ncbi:MAG TPA: EamA family transporter [Bryobacteraceae bacterium]|jgi:drug/metabolite transporter (DMT)-like permease
MALLQMTEPSTGEARRRIRIQVLLAFFAIYFIWGSTYLAIRVAVETVPPFLAAGLRFFLGGAALYLWSRWRGVPAPSKLEWRNLMIVGALMFLLAYSGLFWAEKTVPSGVASVLVAMIPLWTAFLEIFVLRKEHFRWPLVAAFLIGIVGVAILTRNPSAGRLNILACLVLVGCSISWSIGTVISKTLALPLSKLISASGQMLIGGGMLLLLSALAGELKPLPHISLKAAYAIGYLIVAGSIVAFTAYVWLLGRLPATTVTSYAYVNPVVALLIGHWLGQERLGIRTLLGATLVLASVLLILLSRVRDNIHA